MIVVHQSSTYDARFATKRGVDEAVRFAKSKKIPVIYLQDETPDEYYFMEDCHPDHWVLSHGGEISFEVLPSHLYIVGGHLELCMSTAFERVFDTTPGSSFTYSASKPASSIACVSCARFTFAASKSIQLRHIGNCLKSDPTYDKSVADALGIALSEVPA
ncbi:MAG: hypothetical protein M0Q22_12765 [Sulfuritalea sp.]|nr:hypothetical protein [Sulfuritalea sp.]